MKQIKRIMGIDPWKITSNQIEKEDRRLQESLVLLQSLKIKYKVYNPSCS
ncbi:hypothetical protein [Lactococcus cremoris]|nr:hypothetical protein [Lactococcus cremoris]